MSGFETQRGHKNTVAVEGEGEREDWWFSISKAVLNVAGG